MREEGGRNNKSSNQTLLALVSFVLGVLEGISNKAATDNTDANDEIARWTRVVGNWTRVLALVGVAIPAVIVLQYCAFRPE